MLAAFLWGLLAAMSLVIGALVSFYVHDRYRHGIERGAEGQSPGTGFLRAGHTRRWIMRMWLGVVAVSAISAALGYGLLGEGSDYFVALMQAFAAGALLNYAL